ncbi:hypothetical protein JCM19238_3994 [Vibrio ponticus]|nr:hypothetical protein JCM19238_3994 [Vibrio ponticus]
MYSMDFRQFLLDFSADLYNSGYKSSLATGLIFNQTLEK